MNHHRPCRLATVKKPSGSACVVSATIARGHTSEADNEKACKQEEGQRRFAQLEEENRIKRQEERSEKRTLVKSYPISPEAQKFRQSDEARSIARQMREADDDYYGYGSDVEEEPQQRGPQTPPPAQPQPKAKAVGTLVGSHSLNAPPPLVVLGRGARARTVEALGGVNAY